MKLVTSVQMREIEDRAVKELKIPSILLMEHAAVQTVKHIEGKSAVVICGTGNNGGDGFAIARLLHMKGMKVRAVLIGGREKVKGDALINLQIAEKLGLVQPMAGYSRLADADVIVDAIYGTGLHGAITDKETLRVIEAINHSKTHVVSVDIPSGVEADTGRAESGAAVRAHTTVTFGLAKIGHMMYPGTEHAGNVKVEAISIPQEMLNIPPQECLEMLDGPILPSRPARSNKGTFGSITVLAGCADMPGAAALCCKAAYKAGAGLVHACVVPEVARVIRTSAHEVITSTVPEYRSYEDVREAAAGAKIIAMGPGLGRTPEILDFVYEVCSNCTNPMVLDADALYAASINPTMLHKIKAPGVITPHPGEMALLANKNITAVLDDLIDTAKAFAKEFNVVTLLKDARTVIAAPDGRCSINPTGTPALAKAGSGDVLTGIIAAFMAQGMDAYQAAVSGAYIHGKAGQLAARSQSVYSVTAGSVIEYTAKALEPV